MPIIICDRILKIFLLIKIVLLDTKSLKELGLGVKRPGSSAWAAPQPPRPQLPHGNVRDFDKMTHVPALKVLPCPICQSCLLSSQASPPRTPPSTTHARKNVLCDYGCFIYSVSFESGNLKTRSPQFFSNCPIRV